MSQAKLAGHQAIPVPTSETHGWKLTPADLIAVLDNVNDTLPLMLVLTNPGNPSGAVYTRAELEQLAVVCREQGVLVLSDEIYARLVYSPATHVNMSSVYPEGTILTSGFSKWSSAGGWRLGYAHFPPTLSSLRQAVLR